MNFRIFAYIFCAVFIFAQNFAFAEDRNYQAPAETEGRYLAVISDLHLSLGKENSDNWYRNEDFRWPNALRGFLDKISEFGGHQVDLVIAGDFLDLWQIKKGTQCNGSDPELGCSIDDIVELTKYIVETGHADTIKDLAAFSQKGENRVYIIPGNHDAALMLDEVWNVLYSRIQYYKGHIQRVASGVWTSHDGRIVVEHGHQVPGSPNRYKSWPEVADKTKRRLYRTGGELFVQEFFIDEESEYPIVDNLSPKTKGGWYVALDRKVGTVSDLARLLTVFLLETSFDQKGGFISKERVDWDAEYARKELDWKLFVYAMPEDAVIRAELLAEKPDTDLDNLRNDFTKLLKDKERISDDEIRLLCDQAWQLSKHNYPNAQMRSKSSKMLIPVSIWLRKHLETRRREYPEMTHFIYGHTHEFENGTRMTITDTADAKGKQMEILIYNSGAFQRLIDAESYNRRLAAQYPGVDKGEGLRTLTLEKDFLPCYTAVLAPFKDGSYRPETKCWFMDEKTVQGKMIDAKNDLCQW